MRPHNPLSRLALAAGLAAIAITSGTSLAQEAKVAEQSSTQKKEPKAPPKIEALLITGENNHDWRWTAPNLARVLEESGRFHVTITDKPAETLADPKTRKRYQVFVLNYNGKRWGDAAEKGFLDAVRGGVGISVIHAANNAFPGWVEYEKLVALCWRKGTGHGRFHPFPVKIVDRNHPLTRDMEDLRHHPDELYHRLVHMHDTDYRVLAYAPSSKKSGGTGENEPMIIVKQYGKGRIFHTPLGHVWTNVPGSRASYADPQFRHLVARGTEWAATGVVTLPARVPNFLTLEERKSGFRRLFNGRNLDGFRGFKRKGPPEKGWVVKDGAILHRKGGGGGDLMTKERFGDFDLRFEWKVWEKANSGVIFHVQDQGGATYMSGPEYQILDDAHYPSGPKHSAGALYDLVPPKGKTLAPTGSWNRGRILIRAGRISHFVNGVKVLECPIRGPRWDELVAGSKFKGWAEFGKHASGHIAFQDHGDQVAYRSIRIKSYDAEEKKQK